MEVEIVMVEGNELYRLYPGQQQPQECLVRLDCRTGKLGAIYNPEIGNAIPMDESRRHVLMWHIPCLREAPANSLLETIKPLAQSILDGYTSELDHARGALMGVFDEDAENSILEIEEICDRYDTSEGCVRAWSAEDWLSSVSNRTLRREYGITKFTVESEIDSLVERIEKEAEDSGEVDVLTGTDRFVRMLIDTAE